MPGGLSNVTAHVNNRSTATIVVCAFVCAIDGFSTQMMGYTGKSIAADLGFPVSSLGSLFSAGTVGTALGTFLLGMWGDRFGRVRTMALSCLVASVFIAACVMSRNFQTLLLLRTIAGFGLGGALPCLIALSIAAVRSEQRRSMAALIYAALPAGALVGALGSAPLVLAYGWRSVFICAAIMLGVIAAVTAVALREQGDTGERGANSKMPVSDLFRDGRGPTTIALWAFFLFVGPGLILLGLWMPTLMQMLGRTPAQASLLAASLNIGAVLSALAMGWLIARYSVLTVFGPLLVVGALSWPAMLVFQHDFVTLLVIAWVGGCAMGGVITGGVALAATYCSPAMQGTSIGSAVAIARVGQMIAPFLIGRLLASHWTPQSTLLMCAVPTIGAFMVLLALHSIRRSTRATALL